MFTALVAEASAVPVIQKLEASQIKGKEIVRRGHVWQCCPRLMAEDVQVLESWSWPGKSCKGSTSSAAR